jgi:ribosomal protein S6--L-glutamate ligase
VFVDQAWKRPVVSGIEFRMTTLAALVSGTGWHVEDLLRAADRLKIRLHAVPFAKVEARVGIKGAEGVRVGDIDLRQLDGILIRMMPPGSLEQVVFRMDALQRLVSLGVPVSNPPKAVEAAVDKYLSLARLCSAGLPVPETWSGQTAEQALIAFDELGGDVILKPLFGSEGRGLMRISDRELAWRAFGTLERLGSVIYVQRVIRHSGHDLRIFVLRGRVIGSMRRFARPGEWRTNIALGGRAEACRVEPELERLALEATRAIDADMAGIDLMIDTGRGTPVILEVNAVPGWRALSRVTGVDVAAEILCGMRETQS